MILGKIIGKTTTLKFDFVVDKDKNPGKFDYLQVYHPDHEYVLCQIVELIRDIESTVAKCQVIGYHDEQGIKRIRTPFSPKTEVLKAEKEFIQKVISLNEASTGYIGKLEGNDIKVCLDLKKLLSKHCSILAKSGSGKSYTVGVLIEEIMEKNIPVLIIDPHGEYEKLAYPSDEEPIKLQEYGITPKGYSHIQYGNISMSNDLLPLKLRENLSAQELVNLLPIKLSNAQLGLLYASLNEIDQFSFDELLTILSLQDNTAKYNIINGVKYLRDTHLFSTEYTPHNDLIKHGGCTIINLKGIEPVIQEIIVYKLMKDLFEERKRGAIPPFFTILEEAHNFCPERSFGEAKSSKIIRTIASEGRKFGQGLCVISQRPARVDKSVLSQTTTQIILKLTNPQDIKAMSSSVEGITTETENEVQNLPIGTALVCGLVDMPLLVSIRPRRSMHGGDAILEVDESEVSLAEPTNDNNSPNQKNKENEKIRDREDNKEKEIGLKINNKNILPIIKPKFSKEELKICSSKQINKITTYLIPAIMFSFKYENEIHSILIDLIKGEIINDIQDSKTTRIVDLNLNNLKENISYEKIEYADVSYDVLLDKKVSVEDIIENLSKFLELLDQNDCYIIYNRVE